jgi:hypothetical protein
MEHEAISPPLSQEPPSRAAPHGVHASISVSWEDRPGDRRPTVRLTLQAPETGLDRYGPEYGPYAGARVTCSRCGSTLHWTLALDMTDDCPEPIGFCSLCRVHIRR